MGDVLFNIGFSRGYGGYDGYDGGGLWDNSWAEVSSRAQDQGEKAKRAFLSFLARADTSNGPATEEVVQFHLVQKVLHEFRNFVKDHGCVATPRQLTRAEQDQIKKSRKSLMKYCSVPVTKEAQDKYLKDHPHLAATLNSTSASGSSDTPAPVSAAKGKRSASTAGLDPLPSSSTKSKKKIKA